MKFALSSLFMCISPSKNVHIKSNAAEPAQREKKAKSDLELRYICAAAKKAGSFWIWFQSRFAKVNEDKVVTGKARELYDSLKAKHGLDQMSDDRYRRLLGSS